MRSIRSLLCLAALAASPTLVFAADRNGAQLELSGVFGVPSGSYASAGGASLSDYFSAGPGFGVTGTLGVTRRFHVGVRYGVFRGSKDADATLTDLAPAGASLPGSGPFQAHRTLTTSEFTFLLQYRRAIRPTAQWYLDGGAGLLTFVEHVRLSQAGEGLLTLAGYQQDPMWTVGAGFSARLRKNVDLVAGGRWSQAFSSDGDVFASGDDPGFFQATLGLRYPNY